MFQVTPIQTRLFRTPQWQPSGPMHTRIMWVFMVIVFGHFFEHLIQIYQIYALGWVPKEAGGILGLWFPALNSSEVLHFTYNSLLLGGIILLLAGMRGHARQAWIVALVAQSWHFFEHFLLQMQWLTGYYLFGAAKQTSLLEVWLPRPELHFMYNLIVFVPLMVALIYQYGPKGGEPVAQG